MDGVWLSLALVLGFVLLGGVFSASELALVSLRDSQVQRLERRGRRGAAVAHLRTDPNRFLAAVQIGVTLAGFFSAAYGGSTIAVELAPVLEAWGLPEAAASTLALVVVTAAIAYASLVLGELVPKRVALQKSEAVALFVAPVLDKVAVAARPFIWLLSLSTNAVVRLLGLDPEAGSDAVSEEELRDIVGSHQDLSAVERQVVADVFEAADRRLTEVMVPRTEVVFLQAATPLSEAAEFAAGRPHSRYPVIRDTSDDVVGFVHVRDLFAAGQAARRDGRGPGPAGRADPASPSGRSEPTVAEAARPIIALPGMVTVLTALSTLRAGHAHIALVVDEYGGTDGIVTMEDLIEELVGEIEDEFDLRREPAGAGHGAAQELDGRTTPDEVEERLGITLPQGRYETLGGFLMGRLGRIPAVNDFVTVDGCRFTVLETEGYRVKRVFAAPEPTPDPPPENSRPDDPASEA
jgi:putative hemolysin